MLELEKENEEIVLIVISAFLIWVFSFCYGVIDSMNIIGEKEA
jgi:hypothetical protein